MLGPLKDEIALEIGKASGTSSIDYWLREKKVPPDMDTVEKLARSIFKRGGFEKRQELEDFLRYADYPYRADLCDELFPLGNETVPDNQLTWNELQSICADITLNRMATVRHKFNNDLYLRRERVQRAVENFLVSDKRCFVLIGKSGVGKSNLLVALEKELQETRPKQLTFLLYDGANLLSDGLSITETVTRDINDRLISKQKTLIEKDAWLEIAKIHDNSDRQVILVIDAINENVHAKELLSQLNDLIQRSWDWLKIIFSSRPETWQTIKRGVKLVEAYYYRENEDGSLGIELEPFSYSEKLDIFSSLELPLAYKKYSEKFGIDTRFANLRSDIKQMLRDPLSLRLLAEIYKNGSIPDTAKISGLINRYVENLITGQRLSREDILFLETVLLPIMVGPDHYTNAVSVADVEDTTDQNLLNDLFLNSDTQQPKSPVAQSLANLIDAEILVRQGFGYEERIAFKYERFYEFFVGKVLFNSLGSVETWQQHYQDWLAELPQAPFLWGAIRTCLEYQLRKLSSGQSISLLIQLSKISNLRVVEILQAALTEYGQENPENVEIIVHELLNTERSRLRTITHPELKRSQCPVWKRVALQVATNLQLRSQIEFALADYSPAVRAVAIGFAFVIWHRNQSIGFQILENVVQNLFIFNLHTLDAGIGLSLLILFETFRDPNGIIRLRQIWHGKLETLFLVNPNKIHDRLEQWKRWVLSGLLRVGVQFILRIGSDEPPPNAHITVPELRQFFKRDRNLSNRRITVRNLAPYIGIDRDVRSIENVLMKISHERDMLSALLALIIFQRHMIADPETTIPIATKLFEQATTIEHPGPFGIMVTATCVIAEGGFDRGKGEYTRWAITNYLDRFQGKWWTDLIMLRWSQLDALCHAENENLEDTLITPLVQKYIRQMLANNDYNWMRNIIEWDVRSRAVEVGHLRFAFSILELLIQVEETSVRESMIKVLAQARIYYPDEVDDFIEANDVDDEFKAAVRTRVSSENIGDLVGLRFTIFWAEAMIINGTPETWQKIIWLFEQAAECRTLEAWIVKWFKMIINEIYGGSVFTDAPG
jgi:hypothetical protein